MPAKKGADNAHAGIPVMPHCFTRGRCKKTISGLATAVNCIMCATCVNVYLRKPFINFHPAGYSLRVDINKLMKYLLILILTLVVFSTASAQNSDRDAVRQAALDYVEAIYDVNPARVERSVHPDLAKRGFFIKKGETGYSPHIMTFAQLVELAKNYNKSGQAVPKDAPKEVIVFDVADQTASAKVIASWGIDYLHLAKYNGRWQIINILWQSPPKTGK
jgi:hypothetical protein